MRELSNFCERLCVLSDSEVADLNDVNECIEESISLSESISKEGDLSSAAMMNEKETIIQALKSCSSKREAAQILGIDPSTLWRKMKKHDLFQTL